MNSNVSVTLINNQTVSFGPFTATGFVGDSGFIHDRVLKMPRLDYCRNRRGGPRSEIYCEVPAHVPHPIHSGRGRNKWFLWKNEDYEDTRD